MRVLTIFVPLYGQKRKMPNAHLDFSSLLRQASPFRANFPVTHYYKGTGAFCQKWEQKTPRIFKNLWRCCLEQYSILVSHSLFWVKKRTTDFGCPVKMCIMLYYVRLTRLNLKIILLQSICMQRLQALHIR